VPEGEVAEKRRFSIASIRQFLNANPLVVLGLLVLGVGLAVWYAVDAMSWPPLNPSFFTTDGGKTYYRKSGLPPLSNGAVVAKVFSCDGGKTQFVGYLMKYTEEGKKSAEEMVRRHMVWPNNGYLVRKPGDTEWVPASGGMGPPEGGNGGEGSTFRQIVQVKCADGSPAMMITP
jgi:hypothetical protein